jgi:putative membrane protein
MKHLKIIAQFILFIGLGLFLFSRLWNGTLSFYIHPRFNILTVLTAVGLIIVGIVYALHNWQTTLTGEHDHDEQDLLHDHTHDHNHTLSWVGLTILALPIILGVLVEPRPLGANALENREVDLGKIASAQAPEGSNLSVIATAGERNILDWLYLFQRSTNLTEFNGEPAHVIGFVYQNEQFGAEEFMVSRFTVSCCAADATPIGLIVQWPDTPNLVADEWVEVEGKLQVGTFDGHEMPILIAEKVTITEPPAQPYLFQ